MVKVLLCGVFILLAAILLSIGGTMLNIFSVREKCGLKIIGRSAASGGTTAQTETLLSGL